MQQPIVELGIDGVWTSVESDARTSGSISIKRGRSSEGRQVDPSTCELTLDNRDGTYSPRNPNSPYYGLIGRNTPLRVREDGTPANYLHMQADTAYATMTGGSWPGIVNDLDIRIEIEPEAWSGRRQELVFRYDSVGNRGAFGFRMNSDGTLAFGWTADGTGGDFIDTVSTLAVPFTSGRHAVRVFLDVDNGAAGNTVIFYTADSIGGTWTQLGSSVVNAGVTSVHEPAALIRIGANDDFTSSTGAGEGFIGKVYALQVRTQTGASTLIHNLDFSTVEAGTGAFTDAQAWPWAVFECTVVDPSIRFSGEVSDWPQAWDKSEQEAATSISASGILRRLGQSKDVLESPIRRTLSRLETPALAYWPLEDANGSTIGASALDSDPPMTVVAGADPQFSAYEGILGSKPILTLGGAAIRGPVPAYPVSDLIVIQFVGNFPLAGETDGAILLNAVCAGGTTAHWRIIYHTGGDLEIVAVDGDEAELDSGTQTAVDLDGHDYRCQMRLLQLGSSIFWTLAMIRSDGPDTYSVSGNFVGTFGRITHITLNSNETLETASVGHVIVRTEGDIITDIAEQFNGYNGETAGRRIGRLCAEENVPFRWIGNPDDTVALGPQDIKSFLDLLGDAEASDGGILYEPRDFAGLAYRSRLTLYSQDPALTLDYAQGQINQISPVDDDQYTLNDLTVAREGGSSARYAELEGPLSILPPPGGVGRYEATLTLPLVSDEGLSDHAAWRVHLGTVDEPRFPAIGVELASDPFLVNADLTASVKAVDIGDRFVVQNTPSSWLPPEGISQLAQGFTEVIGDTLYTVAYNCQPESPWRVGFLDDADLGRLDTDGSELASSVNTTATSLSVATVNAASPLWTVDDAEFPFDIMVGGELMTVTDITGASSPQSFTVTRSVNGIVKSHASGTDVRLAQPVYVGL